MPDKDWDMYQYILESKPAVRDIAARQDAIFGAALDYCMHKTINEIYLLGSGTSYHASLAARKLIADVLKVRVTVMYAMDFVENERLLTKDVLVIGTSHAGRSASTIKALDKAKAAGLACIGMTAEHGRPLEQHGDMTLYIEIGQEKAGPKTKGFIASIATLQMLALNLAVRQGKLTGQQKHDYVSRLLATTDNIPAIAETASRWYAANRQELMKSRRIIVTGYGDGVSAMMEGTLKVMEAVRYSVTGYQMEEFMHGVYHGIDADTYLIYLGAKSANDDYQRMLRMKRYFEQERHAHSFLITSDASQQGDAHNLVFPFANDPYFMSMEYVVPLQVVARRLSADLGIDCNIPSDPDFHRKMQSYEY